MDTTKQKTQTRPPRNNLYTSTNIWIWSHKKIQIRLREDHSSTNKNKSKTNNKRRNNYNRNRSNSFSRSARIRRHRDKHNIWSHRTRRSRTIWRRPFSIWRRTKHGKLCMRLRLFHTHLTHFIQTHIYQTINLPSCYGTQRKNKEIYPWHPVF